jgi:hypothetical protein
MRAVVHVEVKDRKQAKAIERALEQPEVRAFAITIGMLVQLPDDRARVRTLRYIEDWIHDPRNARTGFAMKA